MYRKIIIALVLLPAFCPAAFEVQSVNAYSIALGSIVSLYPGSLNPAVPAPQNSLSMHANYARLYGLNGLDYYQVQLGRTDHKHRVVGLNLQTFGNGGYRENTVGLGYGQSIRDVVSLGLSLLIYNISITGYQSFTSIGLTLGSFWNLNDRTQIALLFQNINSPTIYRCSDPLPECFSLGVRYSPLSKMELCGELFKDTEFPFSLRVGAIIRPFNFMDLKFGTQLNPDRLSGGISIYWHKLTLNIAIQHHSVLPYTLYYGVGFGLK